MSKNRQFNRNHITSYNTVEQSVIDFMKTLHQILVFTIQVWWNDFQLVHQFETLGWENRAMFWVHLEEVLAHAWLYLLSHIRLPIISWIVIIHWTEKFSHFGMILLTNPSFLERRHVWLPNHIGLAFFSTSQFSSPAFDTSNVQDLWSMPQAALGLEVPILQNEEVRYGIKSHKSSSIATFPSFWQTFTGKRDETRIVAPSCALAASGWTCCSPDLFCYEEVSLLWDCDPPNNSCGCSPALLGILGTRDSLSPPVTTNHALCSGSLGWMLHQVQSPVLAFRCLVHVPCHFIIVKYLSSSNCKQLRTRPYCFLVFCMIFFRHSITTGMKRRRHQPRPSCPQASPKDLPTRT